MGSFRGKLDINVAPIYCIYVGSLFSFTISSIIFLNMQSFLKNVDGMTRQGTYIN